MEFFTRAMVVTRRANRPRKRENERREGRRRKRKRDKRPVIPVALDARWVCITTTRRLLSLHCLSTYQPLLRIVRTFLPTDFYSISFFGKRSKRRTRGSRFRNCSPQIIRPYWYFSFFSFFSSYFLVRESNGNSDRTKISNFSNFAWRKKNASVVWIIVGKFFSDSW